MITVWYDELQDVKGKRVDSREYNWHTLSVNGYGIRFHNGSSNFVAYVRLFQGMEALKFKAKCFHPLTRACTCNEKSKQRHHRRRSTNPRSEEAKLIAEMAALQGDHPNHARPFHKPKLKLRHNKIWTIRFTQAWNHTLGYDGEGHAFITIISQNLNGILSDDSWEHAIKASLRHHPHIICFQELNLKKGDKRLETFVSKADRLGFTAHMACIPSSVSRGGTATLISKSLACSHVAFRPHSKGNSSIASLVIPGLSTPSNRLKIANVYGSQDPKARVAQFQALSRHMTSTTAIVGDFNVVLDLSLDTCRSATSPYENEGANELQSIVANHDLHDEIREQLGLGFEHTHIQTTSTGTCATRLDRHYLPVIPRGNWTSSISDSLAQSDHSAVISSLEIVTTPRGNDVFTLNANLINHPIIHAHLRTIISTVKKARAAGLSAVACMRKLKFEVRKYLRSETRRHAKKTNEEIEGIELQLDCIHRNQSLHPSSEGVEARRELQEKLRSLRTSLRPPTASRARHTHLKEECMSRQFWRSAFSTNRAAPLIECLKNVVDWSRPPSKDDTTTPTTTQVAQAASSYYSHLGKLFPRTSTHESAADRMMAELDKWGVEESTSNEVGANITEEEVSRVCANLPAGKSSGPDRIPNEFYKTFPSLLAPLLTDAFNEMRSAGSLDEGFSDGYVSTLYKKGDRTDPRNYRPITLLNGDYKILTRILAKRMLRIVTQFVSDNQIGFVPRTFIAESTMLMKLIQAHLESIDEGGLLVFLDMEKAFDRCNWAYLHRALRHLRFTSPFTSWIDMLYDESKGTKRQVLANGCLSDKYTVRVGTAQGCPLSPLLFLVIMEGFTRLVNNDPDLQGIKIGDLHQKISHFAVLTTVLAT